MASSEYPSQTQVGQTPDATPSLVSLSPAHQVEVDSTEVVYLLQAILREMGQARRALEELLLTTIDTEA